MANFIRSIYNKDQIGFAAVYRAEPTVDIASVDVGVHFNLIAVHATIYGDPPDLIAHLFSYWRDESSFKLAAPGFQEKLKLQEPIAKGPWGEPKMVRKPWLQIGSLKELILAASAVVGAWTVLEATVSKGMNWLTGSPTGIVLLSASEKNILAGSQSVFLVNWENASSVPVRATASKFTLRNQQNVEIPISLEKGTIPNLAANERLQLNLVADPRKLTGLESGPVDFTLSGWVQGKAGIFGGEPKFEPKDPLVIKVWPKLGCTQQPLFKWEPKPGRLALFDGSVYSGDSLSSLRAIVELSDPALNLEVQYDHQALPVERIPDYGWRAKFQQKDTKKFSAYPLNIIISSPGAAVTDWRGIALKKVRIDCE